MARNRKQQPPIAGAAQSPLQPDLRLLERFTESDLRTWERRSAELEELHHILYHGLEPERIRRQGEIVRALQARPHQPVEFEGWTRMLEYRYSHEPLAATGSIVGIGGRYNVGQDCDEAHSARVFPALYIGQDSETAFREFYQASKQDLDLLGLTAADMALRKSDASVRLRGRIEKVFDASDMANLQGVAKVLGKFEVPPRLETLCKELRLGPAKSMLIRTASSLYENIQEVNWRRWPTQFGLPAPSQRFGLFLLEAGFEAVRYRSVKYPGQHCLAVFPSNIGTDRTFVELADAAPPGVVRRLDMDSAGELCGWNALRPGLRPYAGG